jgi:hypothetical protein
MSLTLEEVCSLYRDPKNALQQTIVICKHNYDHWAIAPSLPSFVIVMVCLLLKLFFCTSTFGSVMQTSERGSEVVRHDPPPFTSTLKLITPSALAGPGTSC